MSCIFLHEEATGKEIPLVFRTHRTLQGPWSTQGQLRYLGNKYVKLAAFLGWQEAQGRGALGMRPCVSEISLVQQRTARGLEFCPPLILVMLTGAAAVVKAGLCE